MVDTNHESGWRHSYFANYFVFSIKSRKTFALHQSDSDKIIPGELGSGKISLALWAPTGNKVVRY
jgi:hypothetical protein